MISDDQRDSAVDLIDQEGLSRRNSAGDYIAPHRAIHYFTFPRSRYFQMLLLPLIFTFVVFNMLEILAVGWMAIYEFWLNKLDIVADVSLRSHDLLGAYVMLPNISISAGVPDQETFQLVIVNTAIALTISFILPSRMLPLKYILRVLVFIQITALLYFSFVSNEFPYSLTSHLENIMIACVYLMLVLPWVHAIVYYIFDFSWLKKISLTLFTLSFLAVFLPFLLLMHVYLVEHFSLLLLPVLYFVCGLFLLIMTCIAFYGWAMSWKRLEC